MSEDLYYNEHDVNQVQRYYKTKKKKRRKMRGKRIFKLILLIFVVAFFISDYSRVKSVKVHGNENVSNEEVLKSADIQDDEIYFFVRTKKVRQRLEDTLLFSKVDVSKDWVGHIKIDVEEAENIAYAKIDKKTYVVNEMGKVSEVKDKEYIEALRVYPSITKFKEVDMLKDFAKEYVQLSELIKNQVSDIVYEPKAADETRVKFVLDNGKIMYLRIEDMVSQLSVLDFDSAISQNQNNCIFSFEGEYIYEQPCPSSKKKE